MRLPYAIHIVAGALALISGYVALYVAKGAAVHRKAGMVFVYAMLTMAAVGMSISMARGIAPAINIPAALLSAYLVVTALTTVRPPTTGARSLHVVAMLLALSVSLTCLTFAFQALAGSGTRSRMAMIPFLMFGLVGLLASIGDFQVIRSGVRKGPARLARHLWRMSFALFIAALSFFIGQAKVIPEPIRIRPLLALPVLAVLVTMFYWLWRVRVRRSLRGIMVGRAHDVSGLSY
jgi:uncharacterized membrane protein